MVTVLDVANLNAPVTVAYWGEAWDLSNKRGDHAELSEMTDFVPASWPDHYVWRNMTCLLPRLFLPEKTGQYFHGDIPVGIFNMHGITLHPPPTNSPFLFILIMFHIVFLYVQYSTFINHCIDVLMNSICCIHWRSSLCTWSYIST